MSSRESARPLTYSEYINDHAIIEALRIPQPPPAGQTEASWPLWHDKGSAGPPGSAPWRPGDPWPRGEAWSHDEVLFIRTHQAFEVWFAVVLHEVGAILRQVQSRLEFGERRWNQVELGARLRDARGFPPGRFPELTRVAQSFQQGFLKNRLLQLPTPGRHFIRQVPLEGLEPQDYLQWAAHVQRAAHALEVTIPFFNVLSSMTPRQFLGFRGRLSPASGFGSVQFREIELILGLREINKPRLRPAGGTPDPDSEGRELPEGMLRPTEETPPSEAGICFYRHHLERDWPRLAQRFREPSLRDLVYGLLNVNIFKWADQRRTDAAIDEFAARNVEEMLSPYDRAQGIDENRISDHIEELGEVLSHRETIVSALLSSQADGDQQQALLEFLETCMELDATLLRWRDQHIRFVEKMIGRRPGTGGTGVNYLRQTTNVAQSAYYTHAFPALWQSRSLVQGKRQT